MGILPLIGALLWIAEQNVTVEPLGEDRYRLTVAMADAASPELYMRAQLRLMAEARRICRGRAGAVSEGALEANRVPGRVRRITISEVYSCSAPSGENRN